MKNTAKSCSFRQPADWATAILFLTASTAPGHDAFETTAEARLDDTGLAVHVTVSRNAANALLERLGDEGLTLTPAPISAVEDRFSRSASSLLEVIDGQDVLPLSGIKVAEGEEGDVEIHFTYPRPATEAFSLNTSFLPLLGQGHYCNLTMADESGGTILHLNQRHSATIEWKARSASEPAPTVKTPTEREPIPTVLEAGAKVAATRNLPATTNRADPPDDRIPSMRVAIAAAVFIAAGFVSTRLLRNFRGRCGPPTVTRR